MSRSRHTTSIRYDSNDPDGPQVRVDHDDTPRSDEERLARKRARKDRRRRAHAARLDRRRGRRHRDHDGGRPAGGHGHRPDWDDVAELERHQRDLEQHEADIHARIATVRARILELRGEPR